MSKTYRPASSTADTEWTVRQMVPRTEWDESTDTCPACGATVDRLEPHYQVELDRERVPVEGRKLTRERRLLAFCGEACATSWVDRVEE